jgi:hypothetical protein
MPPASEALTPDSLLARIRQDGVRRTAQALRKPPLPSSLLQALADLPPSTAPEARVFVAAYPLSPSHLLETLAAQDPAPDVLAFLATNPRTPPHLLIEFATHADASVRAQAALHPQLPARELLALADDPEATVRRALATNASLRLPQQAILSGDAAPSVRLALAGQSALAAPAALVLAIDDSAVVRLHTVAAAPADDDTVNGWASTDEEDVQLALLRRRTLPEAAERLLLQSPHSSVRQAVRDRVEPDEADLLNLATTGETEERRWVAARTSLPRPLQRLLAQDAEATVRATLAANPRLDPAIASYFVDLADEPACIALAANPSVSDEQIQGVAATRRPSVLAALAYREQLDPDLACLLATRSPIFRRHWAFQDRPLSGLDAETARTLLADRLPAIRALAVRGHAWRRADLYDLVRDPDVRVRLAVVQHPNAPDELLSDALSDPEVEIATAARTAQSARTTRLKPNTMPPVRAANAAPPKSPLPSPPEQREIPPQRTAPSPLNPRPAPVAPTPEGNLLSKLSRLFR